MIPAGTCTPSMNDIKQIIADDVKKLDLSKINSSKDDSNKDESIVKELKDVFKSSFLPHDSGSRRDYKLTSKLRFEHFMDYFTSELRAKDLLYVIDPSIKVNENFDEKTLEKHIQSTRYFY